MLDIPQPPDFSLEDILDFSTDGKNKKEAPKKSFNRKRAIEEAIEEVLKDRKKEKSETFNIDPPTKPESSSTDSLNNFYESLPLFEKPV